MLRTLQMLAQRPVEMEMNYKNLVLAAGMLTLGACVTAPYHGSHDRGYDRGYDRNDERDRYADRYDRRACRTCGEVDDIQRVRLREGTTGGGAVLGAIIGGVLGNTVGRGDGRKAATVAGAVAGGFAGNAIERDSGGRYGREAWLITVRLDDGRWAEVTQSHADGLRRGDRVAIENDRVVRIR